MSNPFAYPVSPEIWATHDDFYGMTLRDHFAGLALQGLAANPENSGTADEVANLAYTISDAMLKARGE